MSQRRKRVKSSSSGRPRRKVYRSPPSCLFVKEETDCNNNDSNTQDPTDVFREEERVPKGEAERDSEFAGVPMEILQYTMGFLPRSSWRNARLVCHRWNKAGHWAFDPFQNGQSFLYGVLLDSDHLSRLLEHPRFPSAILNDVPTMSVVFGTLRDPLLLRDLARRCTVTTEWWFACFRRAVDKCNLAAVACLIGPHHLHIVNANLDLIAQLVCSKQHAELIDLVMRRLGREFGPLLRSTNLADWCTINGYIVTLSELVRIPAFCTRANLRRVLTYALVQHLEPLALAVWRIHPGGLDARREGDRSLFKACAHGWLPLAKLLLSRGLSPNVGQQQEALMYAVSYGHKDVVSLLLADRRSMPGYAHNDCIRRALQAGHIEIALMLLADHRVDANDDDDEPSINLLCFALRTERASHVGEHAAIVHVLLGIGADPNRHDHAALQVALRRRNYSALYALAKHPRIEMTRDEFLQVLAEFPCDHDGGRALLQDLMQTARFQEHFV